MSSVSRLPAYHARRSMFSLHHCINQTWWLLMLMLTEQLSGWLSILYMERGSVSWTQSSSIRYTSYLACPGDSLSLPASSTKIVERYHTSQAFIWDLGIQTPVLVLACLTLSPLNHLPSLSQNFLTYHILLVDKTIPSGAHSSLYLENRGHNQEECSLLIIRQAVLKELAFNSCIYCRPSKWVLCWDAFLRGTLWLQWLCTKTSYTLKTLIGSKWSHLFAGHTRLMLWVLLQYVAR